MAVAVIKTHWGINWNTMWIMLQERFLGSPGVPPKILAKKPKFPTLLRGLLYGNGDSQIPISERGLPVSIRGLKWHRSPLWYGDYQGLPYGNGDSQIPIWKRGHPISIRGLQRHQSQHGNGDYQGLPNRNGGGHITIWKWNLTTTIWGSKTDWSPYRFGDYCTIMGTRSYMGTVKSLTRSRKEFVPIRGVG